MSDRSTLALVIAPGAAVAATVLLFGLMLTACGTTRVPAAGVGRPAHPAADGANDAAPVATVEAHLRAGSAVSKVALERDGDTLHVRILVRQAFAPDQLVVLPACAAALDELALELRDQKQLLVTVTVHTDATGTETFNLQQSQQRAEALAGYLIEHGIAARRVRAVGAGESMPLPAENTAEGRDLNRRVDIAITALSS